MNKKTYKQPMLHIVTMQVQHHLLNTSNISHVSSNLGDDTFIYGGGNNDVARGRGNDIWE